MKTLPVLLLIVSILAGCGDAYEPLPSWNEGSGARDQIIAFVEACETHGAGYVEPEDRVAVFDNDGTLWCEKPLYFQLIQAFDAVRQRAKGDRTLLNDPVIKAIVDDDHEALHAMGLEKLFGSVLPIVAEASPAAMQAIGSEWTSTAMHPRFERPYGELVYQPMLELLDYLRAHQWKVFIVTGGGIEFVRGISEGTYGVPRDQVVGSSLVYEWDPATESVGRTAKMGSIDDKAGKPPNIALHIGRRPIIAVGNSDGDLQMLQYATHGDGPGLAVLVHHDDANREYDYDHGTETALEQAQSRKWTVVSIKDDFATVFPKAD